MAKEFEDFGEDRLVDRKFDKRTYSGRSFRFFPGNKSNRVGDADDMEVFDYQFDATSFPDALGQWVAHEVQVAVATNLVSFVAFMEKVFKDCLNPNDEGFELMLEFLPKGFRDDVTEMCKVAHDTGQTDALDILPLPYAFIVHTLRKAYEAMDNHNNWWFADEPQAVIFGNPDIIENMKVVGATAVDMANEGIDEMEKFLKNKAKQEEE